MATVSVMSFNIRFDNPNEAEEDKWANRRGTCVDIINKYKPNLLGLQEPHQHQVLEMAELLPGYKWFGKGRYLSIMGLNSQHNEFNPIFYDPAVLTLDASGTFWYSDTPGVPQTKWDCSAFPRIATWGRFTVTASGQQLLYVNTHFDHESEDARTKAAQALLKQLPALSNGVPVVVSGDLNCGEGSPAVTMLSESLTECSGCGCSTLEGMLGKVGTFVGFDKSIDSQIDFIFAGNGLTPTQYGTIPDECTNGHCCSDHRPIMAVLEFGADAVASAPMPVTSDAAQQAADAAGDAAAQLAGKAVDKIGGLLKGLF